MDFITPLVRIGIVFVLTLIFGLDRQRSHKPVGFGTFIFVALGATVLGVTAVSGIVENPVSLLSAIVTGIGFLGAGALIRGTDKVFGFTTAASIWLFAIFGLTIGIGEYYVGAILYVLAWVIIYIDKYLEVKGIGYYQRKLSIKTNSIIDDKEINKHILIHARKHRLMSIDINKEDHELDMVFIVEGSADKLNMLVRNLYKEEWIKSAKVE